MAISIKTIVLFLTLSCIAVKAYAQHYAIENFSEKPQISDAYVYTITQDTLGYLWIGTADGLYRFDGYNFKALSVNDSLADNFVSCSYKAPKGIWFGHMNGNLSFHNGKYLKKINTTIDINSSITEISASPDGHIWASTANNGMINHTESGGCKNYTFRDNPVAIYSFKFITNNTLFIGSDDGLKFCGISKEGIITTLWHFNEIPTDRIPTILKSNSFEGFIVATSNNGIYRIKTNDKNFEVNCLTKDIDLENIQNIMEDNRANIWVATFGQGIFKLSTGIDSKDNMSSKIKEIIHFDKNSGFNSENAKVLFQDRDENIWAGNYGMGISKLTAQTFSVNYLSENLYGKSVNAIAEDENYRWLGTDKGLLKTERTTGKILAFYSVADGLPNDAISALIVRINSQLWIGTANKGLYVLNIHTNKIERFVYHQGALENSITSLSGSENKIWIGTKKGACCLVPETNNTSWYTINQGALPHNSIQHIFIDSRNNTWIATLSNTLSCIINSQTRKINIPAENGNVTLKCITEDNKGNIWIGSAGQGVFRIQNDSILNLSVKQGLLSDYCYSIIADSNGFLWIGHRGGLSRVNTNDFTIKSIEKYSALQDKFDFNSNATLKCNDGRICFGCSNGLLVYYPELENASFLPPTLQITSISVNNQEVEIKDKIILPPGNHKIRFDYIGISLKEPDQVKYQYRLFGYDNEWSEITHSNSITYPSLSGKNYVFEVNASSSDGITNKTPVRIEIIIRTPLYKQIWIYILISVLAVAFIFFYIKRREYVHITEKRILEQKVKERTIEIQRQKDEIERQRDLIKKKNIDITDSLKYARKIQSAIMPPDELLEKLFPENFLINKPKDIVSGDFCWYAQTNDKIVVTVADCTGHGVPGAIMSILGINSLNEIIINYGITETSRILEFLRLKVISSLSQHSKESPSFDGINLGICVIDQKTLNVQFSGAINNMVHIQDGVLNVIKADRIPIGVSDLEHKSFTEIEFQGKKGDLLYLFSDGFQDQFGGEDDKKFSSRKFISTLFDVHHNPLPQQKEQLEIILRQWMRDTEQTDDITILGVRI